MKKSHIFLIALLLIAKNSSASSDLLFLEFQGVAGYSFAEKDMIYHSAHPHDSMQKNSIGIDYIRKVSNEYKDLGRFAFQARVAYNDYNDDVELQVYNAYYNAKTDLGDVWIGHNRMAFGLGSYWDTHGTLMQSSAMYGFGMDRDWGVGYSKDFLMGNFSSSITTGSGMSLRTYGNWLATARLGYGVLNYHNQEVGFSVMTGEVLDTMGHKVMDKDPKTITMFAIDHAYNYLNMEHKTEVAFGRKNSETAYSMFYRFSYGLLDENKLKLELQPTYVKEERQRNYSLATGASYQVNGDLSIRAMHEWWHNDDEHRILAQIYYYIPI